MNIKGAAAFLAVLLSSAAASAAHKDEAYYKSHPKEAVTKYAQCETQLVTLADAGRMDEVMKLSEDHECQAADIVVKFYHSNV